MRRFRSRWARTAVALALACAAAGAGADWLEPYRGLDPAPALALPDLGEKTHRLEDYRGRVVLVNFWASWCTPCVIEMPGMQRLQNALADKPFTVLAVNVGESRGRVWQFAAQMKLDLTLLLDSESAAAGDWQVEVYPSSFLVDREGRVRYVAVGAREWDSDEMINAIENLMAPATVDAMREPRGDSAGR